MRADTASRAPRKILLIALPALGDVLLCTPLLSAVRGTWPGATVHVLVRPAHGAVLEGNPDVDGVMEVAKHPSLAEYWRLARRIFRAYDLVLSNSASDRAAIYALAAGRERASVVPPTRAGKLPWRHWFYTHWTELDARHCHTLVQNNRVGELIGLEPRYEVTVPRAPGSEQVLSERLGAGWRQRPFAVVHPTPALRFKRWSNTAGWVQVVEHLRDVGLRVVVTSGPHPDEIAYVTHGIGFPEDGVTVLAGKLQLGDLAAMLRQCKVYVGVDTLVTHMAAALGTPTVAILGPTSPVVWGPWPAGYAGHESPYAARGSQRVNNVFLVQGIASCVPCGRRGCEDHRDSRSDCLAALTGRSVIEAIEQMRARVEHHADTA